MTWLSETPGASALERVLGGRPELQPFFREFVGRVWADGLVEPDLLELCRLAIARVHGCESDLALRYQAACDAGLSEEKVAALPYWRTSEHFSERERHCLALAEQFTLDPHGVDDESFGRVASDLGPQGTVALVYSLAVFDGLARLRAILGVEPEAAAPVVMPTPSPAGVLF
jgi:alkylhydroperoxidase family enzyme